MPTTRLPNQAGLDDIGRAGLGFLSWNCYPHALSGLLTPTSQTIHAAWLPLRAGQVVTNVNFFVQTAGAGTVPTSIVCGLANATTMLAQTGELKNSAIWTAAGIADAPLSAPYTVPTSGLYYVFYLANGTWGTTNLAILRGSNNGATSRSSILFYATAGTGQTALPANNAAVTLTASTNALWVAAS